MRRTFAVLACALLTLTSCGGGGGGGGPAPEVQLARELASTRLSRNPRIEPVVTPFVNEFLVLSQIDQNLNFSTAGTFVLGRYQATLQRLAERAQIDRVTVFVSSDLACTSVAVGGGIAGDALIVLDGKFLDVLAEVSNGLALRESGRISASIAQIVDSAAFSQLTFSRACLATDPTAFPDTALSAAELDRSIEIFTQLVGGLFFHEFGHVWNWHALLKFREQYTIPGGGFFTYTSATEDNSDVISGILNAKAGHSSSLTTFAFDLLAFTYLYRRAPGSLSFEQTSSWEIQYQQTAPTYSSLAARKGLIERGYRGWANR